jgi:phage gp29-like protein
MADSQRERYVPIAVEQSDTLVFREPSIWSDSTALWTPSQISNALSAADAGILSDAADLCDAQWTDDRIRGTLQTRVNALLGLNNDEKLDFTGDSKRVVKAIREDWWLSAPETELGKLIRWGLHLGIGFAQRKVVKAPSGRWVPRLNTWNPRHFWQDYLTGLWNTTDRDGNRIEIRPDDPHWITFCPYGEERPWAEGTWRACALYWAIKTYGLRAWGKHNDLHGSGSLVGKAAPGANKADRTSFWNDLKSMGRTAKIVLPDGYTLDILEAESKTEETFVKSGERADVAIAIIHLGQPMTTEVPKGAQTGSEGARAVRQDYLEFDAEQLATWVHDRHLPAWAQWNFGDSSLAPWPRFNPSPPVNLQLEANTLAALAGAIEKLSMQAPEGMELDKEAMFYRYNIPLKPKDSNATPTGGGSSTNTISPSGV